MDTQELLVKMRQKCDKEHVALGIVNWSCQFCIAANPRRDLESVKDSE